VRQSRPSAPRRQGNPFDSCLIISRNAYRSFTLHTPHSICSVDLAGYRVGSKIRRFRRGGIEAWAHPGALGGVDPFGLAIWF
jgi:hypothetical protein